MSYYIVEKHLVIIDVVIDYRIEHVIRLILKNFPFYCAIIHNSIYVIMDSRVKMLLHITILRVMS